MAAAACSRNKKVCTAWHGTAVALVPKVRYSRAGYSIDKQTDSFDMIKTRLAALSLFILATPSWAAEDTLCEAAEKLVWSCHAAKKTYSVCSSSRLSKDAGYMQYRVGSRSKLEFAFPVTREHPFGRFNFDMGPHGGSLEFKNSGFNYSIAADMRGLPSILVEKDGRQIASVRCKDETGDLLGNDTLDLFRETGILR
jgi:hypothetical protein